LAEKIAFREGCFTEGADGPILLGNKCGKCGQVFFPKVNFCFDCLNEEMEEVKLSRQGSLCSYSTCYMPSIHFEPPYAIGYVDMPEGIRVFGPLKIVENKPFKVGMMMKVVIEKLWQEGDNDVIGYKFEPQ